MKKVSKKEPAFFSDFIAKEKPNEWKELINKELGEDKGLGEKIREYILQNEQNHQCAYTEISIDSHKLSSHIDHFKKQSLYNDSIIDWNNLFVSTNNLDYGAKYKDSQISGKNIGIYELLLNPAIDNPLDFFYYSTTGFISPKSNNDNSLEYQKAKTTIEYFNLNHKALIEKRKSIYRLVDSYQNELKYDLEAIQSEINMLDSFIEAIYPTLNQNNPPKN